MKTMKSALPFPTLTASLLAAMACVSPSRTEEPVEIPLADIWALRMPETTSIGEMPSDAVAESGKRAFSLGQELLKAVQLGERDKQGFAYSGDPGLGLLRYEDYLSKKATSSCKASEPCFLLLFTYPSVRYAHIKRVTRAGGKVVVSIERTPHQTRNITSHLAIIPLGKLSQGDYSVAFESKRLPPESPYAATEPSAKVLLQAVCQPFDFSVAP